MLCGIGCFSMMAIAAREGGRVLPTADLLTWRSIIGAIIMISVVSMSNGGWSFIRTSNLPIHFGRNICHFLGQYCWYYAVTLIPMALVFAFEFTSPIWLAILAALFLGERFHRGKAWAIGLGFLGILLVARPGFAPLGEGQAFAFASSLFFALTMLWTKMLARQGSVMHVLFWMTIMQVPMGLIATWIGPTGGLPQIPETGWEILWVVILGFFGLLAHFSLTRAFSLADATLVVPVDYGRLPVIAIIGMMLYNEPLDPWIFAGAGLVLLGNWLNIRHKDL